MAGAGAACEAHPSDTVTARVRESVPVAGVLRATARLPGQLQRGAVEGHSEGTHQAANGWGIIMFPTLPDPRLKTLK